MHADGTNRRRLTNNIVEDRSPSWSPDGTQLAYVSYNPVNWAIFTMNADGTNQRLITPREHARFIDPAWSPDGRQIAVASDLRGRNFEIWIMNADGSGLIRLTQNPAMDAHPVWSRDGSTLLFESFRDGNPEIYRMNADGSDLTRLTYNAGRDSDPSL